MSACLASPRCTQALLMVGASPPPEWGEGEPPAELSGGACGGSWFHFEAKRAPGSTTGLDCAPSCASAGLCPSVSVTQDLSRRQGGRPFPPATYGCQRRTPRVGCSLQGAAGIPSSPWLDPFREVCPPCPGRPLSGDPGPQRWHSVPAIGRVGCGRNQNIKTPALRNEIMFRLSGPRLGPSGLPGRSVTTGGLKPQDFLPQGSGGWGGPGSAGADLVS